MNIKCKFSLPTADELYSEVRDILLKNSDFEKLISVNSFPLTIGGYVENAEMYFYMYIGVADIVHSNKVFGKFSSLSAFKYLYDSDLSKQIKNEWCSTVSEKVIRYNVNIQEIYNQNTD